MLSYLIPWVDVENVRALLVEISYPKLLILFSLIFSVRLSFEN